MHRVRRAEMKRVSKRLWVAVIVAAMPLVGACDGGGSMAGPSPLPTPEPGPRYPNVGGNWRGTFVGSSGSSQATLSLRQSGASVSGVLTVGRDENEVAGEVSEFGILEFEGRDMRSGHCVRYYTTGDHLGLSEQNSRLSGPVRRLSPNLGSCSSGLYLNQGGTLRLDKVL
jgi:hypothetical protein